jgi:hypothetical protein
MTDQIVSVWQSTLQPDAPSRNLSEMRDALVEHRHALGFKSLKECLRIGPATIRPILSDELLSRLEKPSEESFAVFDDPVFLIWLRFLHRAAAESQQDEIIHHSCNLPAVLARVAKRIGGGELRYVEGSEIAFQQDDLDPYVALATPPTYDFNHAAQKVPWTERPGHPVDLECELLGLAIQEIGNTWSELKEQVVDVVKIIGYLPDATFRSCSAARYSGIVYLGNMDESILDLEESIVHEAGHQVLYRLAELTPLTMPGTPLEANYVLPWSGSQRDLFGYLHAFYIYALLAKYYLRRLARAGRYARDCQKRALLIAMGCNLAAPTLQRDQNLTEQAHLIVELLSEQMKDVQQSLSVIHFNGTGAAGASN